MINTGQQAGYGLNSLRSYDPTSREYSRNSNYRDMSTDPMMKDIATNPWKKDSCIQTSTDKPIKPKMEQSFLKNASTQFEKVARSRRPRSKLDSRG